MCLHVLLWVYVRYWLVLSMCLYIRKILVNLYRWWLTRRRHDEMNVENPDIQPGGS